MYLKSIEMVGFKSFANKTRIDLRPGVSGVIGPNGCGKSNIMDAIRWCTGGMSWKQLRSDSMVSVIFAGTARRNPMGLAEVTMTFDNAQSMLPVQYSEVSVSRRIFRSGESEYYLNKTQCRLRDIRELFYDTGIGNDGYAIIDQGGVDFVLKSKPEDRRALFEEAAGVAKYKAKREESLRKLDRVEIDLGRLQDSVSLINEQIRKLDADARKAKLFQKYKTELASMEAGQVLKEIAQLDADAASESERTSPVRERHASLHAAIQAEEGRLAAVNLERTTQEAAAMECNQKIAAHKSEIGRLEERIQNAEQGVRDAEALIADSRTEVERETERAKVLEPAVESAKTVFGQAEGEFQAVRAELEAFDADFNKLDADASGSREKVDGLRRELLAIAESSQEASRGLSAAESRLGQLDYEVRQTLKDHERKELQAGAEREQGAEQEKAVSARRDLAGIARRAVTDLEERLAALRKSSSELSDEAMRLYGESSRLKAQVESLELQGGKDPYWVGAHAVANAGLPGVLGTVRSLVRIEEEYRTHAEDALGERLYAVVCADAAAAKAGVEFLRESGKGRARFLVADSLPEAPALLGLPPEARPVIDHVACDPPHERVMRFLFGEAYAMEGSLYGRHWITGGTAESGALGAKLSDIDTLRERLETAQNASAEIARRKLDAETEAETLRAELAAARTRLSEESGKLHQLEAVHAQRAESLSLLDEEVGSIESEAGRILSDIASSLEEQTSLREKLSGLRAQEEALKARESEAAAEYNRLADEVMRKRLERQHLDKSLENQRKHVDFAKQHLDRIEAERGNLTRSIERRAEQQSSWKQRIEDLGRQKEESAKRLDELHRELAELEKSSAAVFEKLQSIQRDAAALEGSLRQRKSETEELQQKIHESEVRVSGLASRREMSVRRLNDEWELSYEDAKEKYKDQPVDTDRILFLRRRIQSLGNVNLAAPEEYEELVQRRDHLQGQVDDLSQAKQDLHSVIAKINATTRENFRQTFTEVREHFRKLYGVLFDGGEADLVFTDKDNILETGVDIVAQPPGKRLQSISQLSGGEKTLTAIALLFAFFMVRPSPFCMLDEADAALDDANVDRFVSMIQEFTGKTQFLVVSHNKKTMEACDVIYGITMEESGVSQVISVDFEGKSRSKPKESGEPEAETVGA